MNSMADIFVAVIMMAWSVPEGHPAHEHLIMPEETLATLELLGFETARECKDFIAGLGDGAASEMLPVDGAQVIEAECRLHR